MVCINKTEANKLLLVGLVLVTTELRSYGFSDPKFQELCDKPVSKPWLEKYYKKNTCDHYELLSILYVALSFFALWLFVVLLVSIPKKCAPSTSKPYFSRFYKVWAGVFSLLAVATSVIELLHVHQFMGFFYPFTGYGFVLKWIVLQLALFSYACLAIWPESEQTDTFVSLFMWKHAVCGLVVISIVCILEFFFLSYFSSRSEVFTYLSNYFISSLVLLNFSIIGMYLLSTASFALYVNQSWKKKFTFYRNIWIALFSLLALGNVGLEILSFTSAIDDYPFTYASNNYAWDRHTGSELDQTLFAWVGAVICKSWLLSTIIYEASKGHKQERKPQTEGTEGTIIVQY